MTTAKTPAKPSSPAPAPVAPPIPMPPYKLNKLEIRSQEVWQEAYAAIAAVAQMKFRVHALEEPEYAAWIPPQLVP